MKRFQTGFSAFVAIMIVLVAAVIAAAGFAVVNRQAIADINKNYRLTQTPPPPMKTYTDSARKFTFKYPAAWKVTYPNTQPLEGPPRPEPDWTKQSRPVNVLPNSGHSGNAVTVLPGCTTVDTNNNSLDIIQALRNTKDKFHTQQDEGINGFTALSDRLEFKSDAEHYLYRTVAMEAGPVYLTIRFQQYYHNKTTNTNFDDGQNLAGFQAIVGSVEPR